MLERAVGVLQIQNTDRSAKSSNGAITSNITPMREGVRLSSFNSVVPTPCPRPERRLRIGVGQTLSGPRADAPDACFRRPFHRAAALCCAS